jgi:hypothetical protein
VLVIFQILKSSNDGKVKDFQRGIFERKSGESETMFQNGEHRECGAGAVIIVEFSKDVVERAKALVEYDWKKERDIVITEILKHSAIVVYKSITWGLLLETGVDMIVQIGNQECL